MAAPAPVYQPSAAELTYRAQARAATAVDRLGWAAKAANHRDHSALLTELKSARAWLQVVQDDVDEAIVQAGGILALESIPESELRALDGNR